MIERLALEFELSLLLPVHKYLKKFCCKTTDEILDAEIGIRF